MTRTSLMVQSTDTSGKAQQKTITYVNPEADNEDLQTFAQKITAMSTNTYVDSKRIDVTPTTEAYSGSSSQATQVVTKPQPTLSLGVWTKSGTTYTATISYNGDGTLSSTLGTISGTTLSITDADGIFSGVISASEGTTYAASKLAFSYNTEEVQAAAKLEPTLTASDGSYAYNGDGQIFGYVEDDYCLEINRTNKTFSVKTAEGSTVSTYTVYLHATEGTNYAAKSVSFSCGGGDGPV